MSNAIHQKDKGEHGQGLDVERLIKAVQGSQAARVLYEFRTHLNINYAPQCERPQQQAAKPPSATANQTTR